MKKLLTTTLIVVLVAGPVAQAADQIVLKKTVICTVRSTLVQNFLNMKLKEIRSETTIILVTNLVQQARRLANRTAFFLGGECVEIGDTEDLFDAVHRDVDVFVDLVDAGVDGAELDDLAAGFGDEALLPLDVDGVELTGFADNWWIGLSMLHALFVNEHNAICDKLHWEYADWPDERLFHQARLMPLARWTPAYNRVAHMKPCMGPF